MIIVLPGMSGGTVFVIFGIYEQLMLDLAKFKLRPYWKLLVGTLIGIFIGGTVFATFFLRFRDLTAAFLLGSLLASIRTVLGKNKEVSLNTAFFFGIGALSGFLMAGEPIGIAVEVERISPLLLIAGGAAATAAMIIPGVPGSSVLIAMGIYDTMIFSIKTMEYSNLFFFTLGSIIGIVLLVKILEQLYMRYQVILSYFFAGLILGSTRALIPHSFGILVVTLFSIGFGLVWLWSGEKQKEKKSLTEVRGASI
jgi:putative membrane protein